MLFYAKSVKQSLAALATSLDGLSKSEAAKRLEKYGPNQIKIQGEPFWKKLTEPFANIFMLVLFVAAVVSFFQNERIDAYIVISIMIFNAMIYYVQRFSTERVLRSLQKHNRLLVDVVRDGKSIQIDDTELVPGDIVLLDEGKKIPADCRLLEVSSFRVDESQLTGESTPINKIIKTVNEGAELYERLNMVFQGSFVIGGQAKALVVATGNQTEMGKLAELSVTPQAESPVQRRINRLISILVRTIGAVAMVAFGLALWRGMAASEAIRYVLALSVSAVPEGLPIATTVVLVLGMRRMAQKQALVKHTAAIETVGGLTIVASDKTGTLTKNKLTVQHVWQLGPGDNQIKKALWRAINRRISQTHDPLDEAIENYLDANSYHETDDSDKVSLPFNQSVVMSGNLYRRGDKLALWVKGAPEYIIERCDLSESDLKLINDQVDVYANHGFRMVALAHTSLKQPIDDLSKLPKSVKFEFDGLMAAADILRPEALESIKQAQAAGVRVYMITGDHIKTSYHIGKQLGIVKRSDEVFDSRQIHDMDDAELAEVIERTRVFARVIPEHKHRLLTIMNQNHITSMTGDGVNDVPALSGAHVGFAMGSGTSIAKDAGDIILLDNNFRSIVQAIHEGRTIYGNIRRMVAYLLSTNAGEVLVALTSLLLGVPVPVVSVQILWINLATDSCLAIPIGLEPGNRNNMSVPPEPVKSSLFSRFILSRIGLAAVVMATLSLATYLFFLNHYGVDYARTIAFNVLVVTQWANAINSRSDDESIFSKSRQPNRSLVVGLLLAISLQIFAMVGPIHDWLHLSNVSLEHVLITSAVSFLAVIAAVELHKWIGRTYFGRGLRPRPALD